MKITSAFGSQTETLEDLKRINPEWDIDLIFSKVGVYERYLCSDDETAYDLALEAGKAMFLQHEVQNTHGLIFVTQSPRCLIPASTCLLQQDFGLHNDCFTLDIIQGCTGFVYALTVASSLITSGTLENCLIICSDAYNKMIEPTNRTCRPLFSDAATAILIEKSSMPALIASHYSTDGSGYEAMHSKDGTLFMNGPAMLLFALKEVPKTISKLLGQSLLQFDDINLFIFHQASKVIIENLIRITCIEENKVYISKESFGNAVSSSIPLLLLDAIKHKKIVSGMKIMFLSFGVGYSLASCIMQF